MNELFQAYFNEVLRIIQRTHSDATLVPSAVNPGCMCYLMSPKCDPYRLEFCIDDTLTIQGRESKIITMCDPSSGPEEVAQYILDDIEKQPKGLTERGEILQCFLNQRIDRP